MKKNHFQIGGLVFFVFFVILTSVVIYFYLFRDSFFTEKVAASKISLSQPPALIFDHPNYPYTLSLPGRWEKFYQVTEEGNETKFWYFDGINNSDFLFSIKRYHKISGDTSLPLGKILAENENDIFCFIPSDRLGEAVTERNAQMRREIFSVMKSFSLSANNPEEKILSYLSATTTSSQISFLSLEIIANQEKATTTEYYLWLKRQTFIWEQRRLIDLPPDDFPVAIVFTKDLKNILQKKEPRVGVHYSKDLQTIFPTSVLDSNLFSVKNSEHLAMLERLNVQLTAKIISYFGQNPVLTKSAFVKEITDHRGDYVLLANLAVLAKKDGGVNFSIISKDKKAVEFSVSPRAVFVVGTSSPAIPVDQWSQFFLKNSTSTWRTKPFWLDIQDGVILKISPI